MTSSWNPQDLPPLVIFEMFKKRLSENARKHHWEKFENILLLNTDFYQKLFEINDTKFLVKVFERLDELTRDKIGTLNKFQDEKGELFHREEIDYLEEFKMMHRIIFSYLRSIPNNEKEYFEKFIKLSTFLCTVYHYKLVYNKDPKLVVVPLTQNEKPRDALNEYYLFYNRSHIEKKSIGIGKVTLVNNNTVEVEYYYKATEDEVIELKRKYKTLKTSGRIEAFEKPANILILKNLIDTNECIDEFYGPVESFFILKRYHSINENILLGVNCSWNRKYHFPYATALLLIKKSFYDDEYENDQDYRFEHLKKNNEGLNVPPEIYYYLFHQSISLQDVIEANKDQSKTEVVPFSKIAHIPFSEEVKFLKQVIGKYKGYTIISTGQKEYLQISQLEIFPNGIVYLAIKEEQKNKENITNENIGFVKYINIDSGDKGKLYISLRYNYGKHFNSLNIYLEFNKTGRPAKITQRERVILRGGYAGESIITGKPISATVIFEETEDDFLIGRTPILDKDAKFNCEVQRLYESNQALFDFFIHNHYSLYSNDRGINLLKNHFQSVGISAPSPPDANYYDVFISIPLTSNESEEEYERNCLIAVELKKELIQRFKFKKTKIYCACIQNDSHYDFSDYKHKMGNPEKEYEKIHHALENSRALFFVYPQMKILDISKFRISSSIIEIGFALGLKKKVIILCDENQRQRLPQYLVALNHPRIFTFDSLESTPIKVLFDFAENEKDIKQLLEI